MMAVGSDNELERLRAARMAEMQSQIEARKQRLRLNHN